MLVIGQSGSGKTTLARHLAAALGVPHVELDALFHGPGWTASPTFVSDVRGVIGGEAWVVDGNYGAFLGSDVWQRADTVVWLDLPRTTTVSRAITRTVRRIVLRTHLWNGNRERVTTVLRATHPIRWTWSTFHANRAKYEALFADPAFVHVTRVRLQSPSQVAAWLASVSRR